MSDREAEPTAAPSSTRSRIALSRIFHDLRACLPVRQGTPVRSAHTVALSLACAIRRDGLRVVRLLQSGRTDERPDGGRCTRYMPGRGSRACCLSGQHSDGRLATSAGVSAHPNREASRTSGTGAVQHRPSPTGLNGVRRRQQSSCDQTYWRAPTDGQCEHEPVGTYPQGKYSTEDSQ